ncbi:MAG: ribosome biogenesis GTPase [Glaciecola sp.]|jgi:ribosome biogenesis GTPase
MGGIDFDQIEDDWADDEPGQRANSKKLSVKAKAQLETHNTARVIAVDRGRVTVLFEEAQVQARFAGAMRGTKVLVADEVRIKPPKHENDQARIVGLLDRVTTLTRTADDGVEEERVVVANAEQVVVVLTAEWLEGGVGFLDRVLVAASVGGLQAIVCINKMDLVEPGSARADEITAVAARYRAIGCPVVETSAETEHGLDELRELLRGHWSAFAGHSGVGKTSIFNALIPDMDRAVAVVGKRGGRHTTVASFAHRVEPLNAWLIDTPGVRSFGLATVDAYDLADHFPEFSTLEPEQRLLLENEGTLPEDLGIDPDRLAFYRRLRATLAEDT